MMLETITANSWQDFFPDSTQHLAIKAIENGEILFFPNLSFTLLPEEMMFLTPHYADPKSKNISYQMNSQKLWGVQHLNDIEHFQLKIMLDRYANKTYHLIKSLLPHYANQIIIGRTSCRTIEIANRKISHRKDDKRLHVDAFPSAPNQGKRILRVFTNINPDGQDRIWRYGEPFETVVSHFKPRLKRPLTGTATLLRLLRITKSYRTLYDHYMLLLHDHMKMDDAYQKNAAQHEIRFPPGTSWIAMTDKISHAALKGQHMLEQTFYLPVKAMHDEKKSPLFILEDALSEKLV